MFVCVIVCVYVWDLCLRVGVCKWASVIFGVHAEEEG